MKLEFNYFAKMMGMMKKVLTKGAPELDAFTMKLLFNIFEKYTAEQFSFMVEAACSTCKFWPSPAEMQELLTGKKEDIAEVTATALIEGINSIKSQDALYEARVRPKIGEVGHAIVMSKGGWRAFVELTDETPLGVFKKQLVDEIEAKATTSQRQALMPPEVKNQLEGLADQFSLTPALPTRQNK